MIATKESFPQSFDTKFSDKKKETKFRKLVTSSAIISHLSTDVYSIIGLVQKLPIYIVQWFWEWLFGICETYFSRKWTMHMACNDPNLKQRSYNFQVFEQFQANSEISVLCRLIRHSPMCWCCIQIPLASISFHPNSLFFFSFFNSIFHIFYCPSNA